MRTFPAATGLEANLKRLLRLSVLAITVVLAFSPAAPAAELVGTVVLSGEPVAEVVISIEGLKLEGRPERTVYVIDHRDLKFVPHVLVVRAGTAVRFESSDGMPCRVYSISPAGTFVLRQQGDKPLMVRFARPGVIEVRCAEHGQLRAYVVVKENPYFALTDARGRYQISNVPPGRYTLQAWYEGTVLKNRAIEVGEAKLKIDFQASRPRPKARTEQGSEPAPSSGLDWSPN